jgi:hypothetical protein
MANAPDKASREAATRLLHMAMAIAHAANDNTTHGRMIMADDPKSAMMVFGGLPQHIRDEVKRGITIHAGEFCYAA